jgi:hypothetical protein
MNVVDLDTLIAMKQTQRAKDYAVIGELATLLPPQREIELTTNPDRILALAPTLGRSSTRPAVRAATASNRHAVVLALAEEIDALQQTDRRRVNAYAEAARSYVQECRATGVAALPLREAHARMLDIAGRLLPPTIDPGSTHADAQ